MGILYIFASISICHLLVGSSIFAPIRKIFIKYEDGNNKIKNIIMNKIKDLLGCYQCSGFWVGFFTFFIWCYLDQISITFMVLVFDFIVFSPIISLMSDLTYRLKQYLCKAC